MNKKITVMVSATLLFSSFILPSVVVYAETRENGSEVSVSALEEAQIDMKKTKNFISLSEDEHKGAVETELLEESVTESLKVGDTHLLDPITQDTLASNTITTGTWKGGTAAVRFDLDTGTLTVEAGTITNLATSGLGYVDEANTISQSDVQHIVFESGTVAPADMTIAFAGITFSSLASITGDLNTSNVTNMTRMFYNANNLTTLDVSGWDTSNVTNMFGVFEGAESLTAVDVSNWNTSNVTSMLAMFSDASALTTIDVSSWDTSNVTTMRYMFSGASSLMTLEASGWNTSKVTDMASMFGGASNLTAVGVSGWDTSNVTNMVGMFYNASSLTTIDVSNWDVSSVSGEMSGMYGMFEGASSLKKLDLSNWDTSNERNIMNMFNGVRLETLVLGEKSILNPWVELELIPTDTGEYTGRWIRVEPETPLSVYQDTRIFMRDYDGSLPGTYVWERADGAPVTVRYVDEEGTNLSDSEQLEGKIGLPYETSPKVIENYTLKEVQGAEMGVFMNVAQEVTYVYAKEVAQEGTVIVHYVDESGEELVPKITLTGILGNEYKTEQKTIAGYTFKEVIGKTTGIYEEAIQEVTYVYAKEVAQEGTVIVHYVDESGEELVPKITLTGILGNEYKTEQKTIVGYTFKEVIGKTKGVYEKAPQEITYVYMKEAETKPSSPDSSDKIKKGSSTYNTKSGAKLPQTGEKQSLWFAAVGGILFLLSVGYWLRKKKH